MDPVSRFLLTIAGIFVVGAVGEVVFARTRIPDAIWLITVGIVLGPVTGLVNPAQIMALAPYFAALTLIIVLFEGGSSLELGQLSRAAPRALLLALLGFVLSVVVVTGLTLLAARQGLLPDSWTVKHGLMTGAILGGSSSIIIMPALATARVEARISGLLSLESALTDALCVVGAGTMIEVILLGGLRPEAVALAVARSSGIGLGMGVGMGLGWMLLLHALRVGTTAYPLTLAALLALFVAVSRAGGSAALGVLGFALVLGNGPSLSRRLRLQQRFELATGMRETNRQLTFMVKSFFFTFMGLMLARPWSMIGLGGALALALLVARVPAVAAATLGSGLRRPHRRLIVLCLPRGMAAGVLATMPAAAGVPGTGQLPAMVFACVFATIVLFALGFPLALRRLPPAPAAPTAPPPAPPPASPP